ncbi:MAG TPA: hypothetical protein VM840_08060 [Actinomycetota bacterium]|jgi:ketosteroid isomerase-like protein|nr:hypothetical protein [Actinomycetota bacterium]
MYRLLARALVRRAIRSHQAGDVRGVLRTYARDVHFVFPGRSSWSADLRGRQAVEPWLRRFHEVGLQLDVDEIVIGGWPWRTVIVLHFTDHLRDADGRIVYENTGVIYGHARWGMITYYTVYEDTQRVAELDTYLMGAGRT